MITKLTTMLGFRQEHSSSFYPQANGQVEAVNKTLKTILKHNINVALFKLAHYDISHTLGISDQFKTSMGFSPFQLIHWVEAVTLVECEIPSLKISIHVLLDMIELE